MEKTHNSRQKNDRKCHDFNDNEKSSQFNRNMTQLKTVVVMDIFAA